MPFKPIRYQVAILPDPPEEKTASGLYIPEQTQAEAEVLTGTIVALASNCSMGLAEGDHVIFGKYVGTPAEIDGQVLLVMREAEVFAIISKTEEP